MAPVAMLMLASCDPGCEHELYFDNQTSEHVTVITSGTGPTCGYYHSDTIEIEPHTVKFVYDGYGINGKGCDFECAFSDAYYFCNDSIRFCFGDGREIMYRMTDSVQGDNSPYLEDSYTYKRLEEELGWSSSSITYTIR